MTKLVTRNKILILIKVLVTFFLIRLVFDLVDINSTIQHLKEMNIIYFGSAAIFMVFGFILANFRWQLILKQLNISILYFSLLSYFWIGAVFNQALPSSIGGDAVRAYYLWKYEGYSLSSSSIGVLLDRYIGLISLIILIAISSPLSFQIIEDNLLQSMLLLVIFGSLLIVITSLLFGLFCEKFLHLKFVQGLSSFSNGLRVTLLSKQGIYVVSISILIHLIFVFSAWVLSTGMDMNLPLIAMIIVIPITNLLAALPISIAGWGVREGVMVAGLGYLDVPLEFALALSILYGLLILVVSLPGLVCWIWRKI